MTAITTDQRALLELVAAESHEWEEGWREELEKFIAQMHEDIRTTLTSRSLSVLGNAVMSTSHWAGPRRRCEHSSPVLTAMRGAHTYALSLSERARWPGRRAVEMPLRSLSPAWSNRNCRRA
jgi:hypothetical protein